MNLIDIIVTLQDSCLYVLCVTFRSTTITLYTTYILFYSLFEVNILCFIRDHYFFSDVAWCTINNNNNINNNKSNS